MPGHYQPQPRQAIMTGVMGAATFFRSSSDQNPVLSCFSSGIRYDGIQSPVVQCVMSQDWLHFNALKETWRSERGVTSSTTQSAMCYSYQKIIAMGNKAVPFILHDLRHNQDQPDQWFWALRVITGENPVPNNHRGNFPAMAQDWLQWSRQREFQPTLE